LSEFITTMLQSTKSDKSCILMIDEVDKSSNNQLFLDFLTMLRDKYLDRNNGEDITFQSVILAGVHDIKSLKSKIRSGKKAKYNSPWNIAVDFEVDMNFDPAEIATMLEDYRKDKRVEIDIPVLANKLHYYTSGYPYLVSKLCKIIDEKIVPARDDNNWYTEDVDTAFQMVCAENYTTTLFDSLIKNLENNSKLHQLVYAVVFGTEQGGISFNIKNPLVRLSAGYGIVKEENAKAVIHNRVFEQIIYDYMRSKKETAFETHTVGDVRHNYAPGQILDCRLVLSRFQQFMKEHRSHDDNKFLEHNGRLVFLSFLKPIVNGHGFLFKEPVVGDERRMDVVAGYESRRHVFELKIWYGSEYHKKGLQQLSDYLDLYDLSEGYLLIFDFRKDKEYKNETITFNGKTIFAVWV